MPKLGESVTEGTISQWLIEVGDKVKRYDPIAEVTTDKVNAEVPSSFSGTIKELIASEGDTIEVGELMCYIETEEALETKEDIQSPTESIETPKPAINQAKEVNEQPMKKRYSPAVLRIAQEHNIDLEQVNGSGKGGRITRKDLTKMIELGDIPTEATKNKEQISPQSRQIEVPSEKPSPTPYQSVSNGDKEIPLTGVRRAIAANMVKSKHEAPHAWMMIEVDVTNLVNYRNSIKNEFKNQEGYSITYLPFFIKEVVEALKEYPRVNSMWAGDKIIEKKDINISVAVAAEEALYVPVIKQADDMSIKGIARSIKDLATKVRTNKLRPEDMQDGTFTLNNTGSFGSIQSQPIINYPQAAILSVESIVKRPVVMNDNMIAIRDMVNLCMSVDHRILDGLICGRFLASVKDKLENISPANTSLY